MGPHEGAHRLPFVKVKFSTSHYNLAGATAAMPACVDGCVASCSAARRCAAAAAWARVAASAAAAAVRRCSSSARTASRLRAVSCAASTCLHATLRKGWAASAWQVQEPARSAGHMTLPQLLCRWPGNRYNTCTGSAISRQQQAINQLMPVTDRE